MSKDRPNDLLVEKLLMPLIVAIIAGVILLYLEHRTNLFEKTRETSPTISVTNFLPTNTPLSATAPIMQVPPTPTHQTVDSKLYDWIPFHVISSSCTEWASLIQDNFTTSLMEGVFTIGGTKQEGIYWAEEAGYKLEDNFKTSKLITIEMTGSWMGTGSGWRAGVKLSDMQNSVFLAGVYDAPKNSNFLTVATHIGRHEYPLDIGGCGEEIVIAENFNSKELHSYKLTYTERSNGTNIIANISSSVDGDMPYQSDLPWKLTNPSIILFASARDIGDSVNAVIKDVVITNTP
jgi:hypothetical protein